MAQDEEKNRQRWERRQAIKAEARSGFRGLAKGLGVTLVDESPDSLSFAGELKGSRVEITRRPSPRHPRGERVWEWRVRVSRPDLPTRLALEPQMVQPQPSAWFRGVDHLTGDERFDAAVVVGGKEELALAVLDQTTRARVMELFEKRHAKIERGMIAFTRYNRSKTRAPRRLEGDLKLALRLARRFAETDVIAGLFDNARRDPISHVRLRNTELLAELDPERIRMLPKSAFKGLFDFMSFLADRELSDPGLRAEVAERLRSLLATPGLADGLDALLKQRRRQGRKLLDAVLETTPELIDSLGERALIELIPRVDRERRVRLFGLLERRGGEDAIAAVLPYTSGLFKRPSVKEAAVRAVNAIEARLGRDGGKLSLSKGSSGALALSEEGGGVALVEE